MRANSSHRLKSSGLAALLVVIIGQSGLLLHESVFDHLAEESCEVCSSFDRQVWVPVSANFEQVDILASTILPDPASLVLPTQKTRIYRLRGPPIL